MKKSKELVALETRFFNAAGLAKRNLSDMYDLYMDIKDSKQWITAGYTNWKDYTKLELGYSISSIANIKSFRKTIELIAEKGFDAKLSEAAWHGLKGKPEERAEQWETISEIAIAEGKEPVDLTRPEVIQYREEKFKSKPKEPKQPNIEDNLRSLTRILLDANIFLGKLKDLEGSQVNVNEQLRISLYTEMKTTYKLLDYFMNKFETVNN